jgi:hypothetical protein
MRSRLLRPTGLGGAMLRTVLERFFALLVGTVARMGAQRTSGATLSFRTAFGQTDMALSRISLRSIRATLLTHRHDSCAAAVQGEIRAMQAAHRAAIANIKIMYDHDQSWRNKIVPL